jgi:peroxiredoxin
VISFKEWNKEKIPKTMKLQINQTAPPFDTADVYSREVSLQSLRAKKIYLAFERNAGCPVCNLHTHQLLKQAQFFSDNNVAVVLVYESTREKMREHLGDKPYPFYFIADPENNLYKKYHIQRSLLKVTKGLFHGLIAKANAGKKLFKKPMKQDGNMGTIPAEFLINEKGRIAAVHYGEYVGDHLPIDTLKQQLSRKEMVVEV